MLFDEIAKQILQTYRLSSRMYILMFAGSNPWKMNPMDWSNQKWIIHPMWIVTDSTTLIQLRWLRCQPESWWFCQWCFFSTWWCCSISRMKKPPSLPRKEHHKISFFAQKKVSDWIGFKKVSILILTEIRYDIYFIYLFKNSNKVALFM